MKSNKKMDEKLRNLNRDITWEPHRQQLLRQRLINKMNEKRTNPASWFKQRFFPAISVLMFAAIVMTLVLSEFTGQDSALNKNNAPNDNDDTQSYIANDEDKKDTADNPDTSADRDGSVSLDNEEKENAQDKKNTETEFRDSNEEEKYTNSSKNGADNSEETHERFLTQEEIMVAVKEQMKTNLDIKLPTEIPLKDSYRLTATTSANATNAEIIFYQHKEPIPINNKLLFSDASPAMVVGRVTIKEYNTRKEADRAIAYEVFSEQGSENVDLGYGMTGYQDGAAGSLHTSWNVGRWALTVKSNTKHSDKNISLAKEVVRFLTEEALPIPQANGYAHLDADNNENRIMWQKDNTVYTIDKTNDTMIALKMAVNFE